MLVFLIMFLRKHNRLKFLSGYRIFLFGPNIWSYFFSYFNPFDIFYLLLGFRQSFRFVTKYSTCNYLFLSEFMSLNKIISLILFDAPK